MSVPVMRRRELVGGAALAAAGALLLGRSSPAAAQSADASTILGGVQLERALSVAYADLAKRSHLGADLQHLLALMGDHEARHGQALLALAEYSGAEAPPMPTLPAVLQALPGLRAAVDRPSTLKVLDELERAELLGFFADQQVLTDAKLIQLVGAVMCSDAQHLALVRQAAGHDPIPSALETGNER
ncbi:MAG: hypothetical protein LC720_00550 [Actinobacteria bacterium]|nr:hypothetical protein [Actinomycetota bacterium]